MADLKLNTKTVHDVEGWDFEEFVAAHGGKQYSFQADQEIGDDATVEFHVTGEVDNQEGVDKTLAGEHDWYVTGDLLNHFAAEGLIPTGDYMIHTR